MEALSRCSDQTPVWTATLSCCFHKQPTTEHSSVASAGWEGRGQVGRVGQYCRRTIIEEPQRLPACCNETVAFSSVAGLPCHSHLRARWKGGGVRLREFPAVSHALLEIRYRNLQVRWSVAARVSQKVPPGACQRIPATIRVRSASHETRRWHMDKNTAGLSADLDTKYIDRLVELMYIGCRTCWLQNYVVQSSRQLIL